MDCAVFRLVVGSVVERVEGRKVVLLRGGRRGGGEWRRRRGAHCAVLVADREIGRCCEGRCGGRCLVVVVEVFVKVGGAEVVVGGVVVASTF